MASTLPPKRITGLPGLEEAIKNAKRELPLMTRDEIEALIAEGRKILIVYGQVLKVDSWCKYHPGGDIAILHMVGKDASNEIDAYVETCVDEVEI
jgi:sphingolipid 8-(E)-desaturase